MVILIQLRIIFLLEFFLYLVLLMYLEMEVIDLSGIPGSSQIFPWLGLSSRLYLESTYDTTRSQQWQCVFRYSVGVNVLSRFSLGIAFKIGVIFANFQSSSTNVKDNIGCIHGSLFAKFLKLFSIHPMLPNTNNTLNCTQGHFTWIRVYFPSICPFEDHLKTQENKGEH